MNLWTRIKSLLSNFLMELEFPSKETQKKKKNVDVCHFSHSVLSQWTLSQIQIVPDIVCLLHWESCHLIRRLLVHWKTWRSPGYKWVFRRGAKEEASAGSPSASDTQEPQSPDDGGEKRCFNCLSELLPTFSWRSIPQKDTEIQPWNPSRWRWGLTIISS